MSELNNGPSRRSVLKGVAWSVPVLAVATTAPMAAASGVSDLDFYLTAGQVIGQGLSGQFRSNGIRLTSPNGETIPAGVTVQFTLTYSGAQPVKFDDPVNGIPFNVGQNVGWTVDPIEPHRVVFTQTSLVAASQITFPAVLWALNAGVRPENDSITFTGVATVPAGADYPNGGTLTNLVVDPEGGTGGLSGPTDSDWPA